MHTFDSAHIRCGTIRTVSRILKGAKPRGRAQLYNMLSNMHHTAHEIRFVDAIAGHLKRITTELINYVARQAFEAGMSVIIMLSEMRLLFIRTIVSPPV